MVQKLVGLGSVVSKLKVAWNTRSNSQWENIKAEREKSRVLKEELEVEQRKSLEYEGKCRRLEENVAELKGKLSESTVDGDSIAKLQEENENLKNSCVQYEAVQQKLRSKLTSIEQRMREISVKAKETRSQREKLKISLLQSVGIVISYMRTQTFQLLNLIKRAEESNFDANNLENTQDFEDIRREYETHLSQEKKNFGTLSLKYDDCLNEYILL